MFPDKTSKLKGKKCVGEKSVNHQVNVSVCANMKRTEKWQLLVIGKNKKTQMF